MKTTGKLANYSAKIYLYHECINKKCYDYSIQIFLLKMIIDISMLDKDDCLVAYKFFMGYPIDTQFI